MASAKMTELTKEEKEAVMAWIVEVAEEGLALNDQVMLDEETKMAALRTEVGRHTAKITGMLAQLHANERQDRVGWPTRRSVASRPRGTTTWVENRWPRMGEEATAAASYTQEVEETGGSAFPESQTNNEWVFFR